MMDRYIDIHTHYESDSDEILAIVNQFAFDFRPKSYYSIGVHPWHMDEDTLNYQMHLMRLQLSDSNCLAVGECGLDSKIETPLHLQIAVFEKQLDMAKDYNKPVILHCVGHYQESAKLCLKYGVQAIFHGFSKASLPLAEDLIGKGFYLSFGDRLLTSPKLCQVFLDLPKDKIFLETDSSTVSIIELYQWAQCFSEVDLKDQIMKNYINLFYNK